jgi:hypothetical protein
LLIFSIPMQFGMPALPSGEGHRLNIKSPWRTSTIHLRAVLRRTKIGGIGVWAMALFVDRAIGILWFAVEETFACAIELRRHDGHP